MKGVAFNDSDGSDLSLYGVDDDKKDDEDLLSYDPFSKEKNKRKDSMRNGGKHRREVRGGRRRKLNQRTEEEDDNDDDLLSYNPFSCVLEKGKEKMGFSGDDSEAVSWRDNRNDTGGDRENNSDDDCNDDNDDDAIDTDSDIDKAVAMRKAESAFVSFLDDVKLPSQLFWYRTSPDQNGIEDLSYRPCFCDYNNHAETDNDSFGDDEESHLLTKATWRTNNDSDGRILIQYIIYPPQLGERDLVSAESLIPYYGDNDKTRPTNKKKWCEKLSKAYRKERERQISMQKGKMGNESYSRRRPMKSDMEAEMILLKLILQHVNCTKIEKQQKEDAPVATDEIDTSKLKDEYDSEVEVDEHDFSLEEPYTQALPQLSYDSSSSSDGGMGAMPPALRLSANSSSSQPRRREPIRPGDVIEYYTHIHVAGDKRGLRTATVLSVDPNRSPILVLDNGEFLTNDTTVKRIKVLMDGSVRDHPGIYRPIEEFKLRVMVGSGAGAAEGIRREARRLGNILQKNISEFKSKAKADGFAPLDLLNRYGKAKGREDETLSGDDCAESSRIKGVRQQQLLPEPQQASTQITFKSAMKSTSSTSETTMERQRDDTIKNQLKKVAQNDRCMHLFTSSDSSSSDSSPLDGCFLGHEKHQKYRQNSVSKGSKQMSPTSSSEQKKTSSKKHRKHGNTEQDDDGITVPRAPQCFTVISSQSSPSSSASSSALEEDNAWERHKIRKHKVNGSKGTNGREVVKQKDVTSVNRRREKNSRQQISPPGHGKTTQISISRAKANIHSSSSSGSPLAPLSLRKKKTSPKGRKSSSSEINKTTSFKSGGDTAISSSQLSYHSSSSDDDDFMVSPRFQRQEQKKLSPSNTRKFSFDTHKNTRYRGSTPHRGDKLWEADSSPIDIATKVRRLASSVQPTSNMKRKRIARNKTTASSPPSGARAFAMQDNTSQPVFRISRRK